ncbi:hypothetical protein KI387_024679, partial [Taxus chinensis]
CADRTSAGRTEVHRTKFAAEIQIKSAKSDILSQAVRAIVGSSGREKAKRPQAIKIVKFFFARFGTTGKKVCAGCKSAYFPKDGLLRECGDFRSGQLGQKYTQDARDAK